MASIRYRSIEEIKETLQNAKSRGKGCALLIGAGCSVKAGIPTAAGFVDIIEKYGKHAYERAPAKTYPKCMRELLPSERRDLIAQYVDKAKINWAHLCIALLMQEGYVDRVLTTNFDLLVARACAMLGVFPAIYDFATSQLLKKADIPDQAVFYLHGQRTGFVLMNTEEDMEKHSKLLGPVFEDAGSGRVWIVVGYSGENDPVFNHLASFPTFDNGLFWIGYGDQEPARHVREQLLTQDKDAFFTKGFDADSFFTSLTQALKIFPPDLVARPFTYLQHTLSQITPFTDQTFEDDVTGTPRSWILSAIDQFETPAQALETIMRGGRPQMDVQKHPAVLTVAARCLLMKGDYREVLAFRKDFDESRSPELANVLSIAYVVLGNQLLDRAKATTGEAANRLFTEAREMYEAALDIKPDREEALHNWGNLLLDLAKVKTGQEADKLFDEAKEKYEKANSIKPDRHEVLINWGNLLLERAKRKTGGEAEQFFIAAEEKYKAALDKKPGMPEIFLNWGNLLLERAKKRAGEESGKDADELFIQADGKYKEALAIKQDMYEALNNRGNLFLDWGKTKTGQEADQLFDQAEENYRATLAIKPDMYDALDNWGNLLLDQAKMKMKTGQEADQLFDLAEEKYKAAHAIRPDRYEVLNNWGNVLSDRARRKTGQEADQLFREADEKYKAALAMKPGASDVLHNRRNLYRDWARTKTGQEAAQLLARAEN